MVGLLNEVTTYYLQTLYISQGMGNTVASEDSRPLIGGKDDEGEDMILCKPFKWAELMSRQYELPGFHEFVRFISFHVSLLIFRSSIFCPALTALSTSRINILFIQWTSANFSILQPPLSWTFFAILTL